MYRLDAALQEALAAGATVIAPNRQRAVALRYAWAWRQREAGLTVWNTPDVLTWEAWLGRELARHRHETGDGPALLNPSQQQALWEGVLEELSDDFPDAGDLRALAGPVATAASLAREWLPEWRGPAPTEECALLLKALQRFDAECARRGVLHAGLATPAQLQALPAATLVFAGVTRLTPRQQWLAEAFAARGGSVRALPREIDGGSLPPPRLVSLGNAADEASQVAEWCRSRLAADPLARLLVVAGDTRADPAILREAIVAGLGEGGEALVALEGGEPLDRQPLIGAALGWLSLTLEDVSCASLSALLVGPFHRLGSQTDCARLDLWLRDQLPQRVPLRTLRDLLRRSPAPLQGVAARLEGALGALREQLPPGITLGAADWVRRFSGALEALGYPGERVADSGELQAWKRWEAGLEEYASLHAWTRPCGAAAAVGRLEALAARSQHQAATDDAPVTVTRWREDPVVGYDGIWVTGLSELNWPEAPRPDAFLPLSLQRAAGMPGASARTRLETARSQLQAWQARAASGLVLSYPRAEGDLDLAPGVLLRDMPCEHLTAVRRATQQPGQALEEAGETSLPPLAADGQTLRAGARLPELQRECPFRAQAELRLRARAVPEPRVGIDPRLRGKLLHKALEVLWRRIGSSEALRSRPPEGWHDAIDAALEETFASLPQDGVPPTARELARERDRCRGLLRDVLLLETRREAEFVVERSEFEQAWDVAGVRLRLRIDRLDRLPDGSLVIIDYKTGASARVDLLGDAPRPVQLLAYLDALGGDVAGLALLKLVPGQTEFRGVEDGRAALPRRKRGAGPTPDWAQRLAAWRADVEGLVRSHVAGDARLMPLPGACQYCELPALCRIDSLRLNQVLEGEGARGEGENDESSTG